VSDLTAEDYARVAVAIGMEKYQSLLDDLWYWKDPAGPPATYLGENGVTADLPAYLAEPAQMVRIMEELKVSVRFDVELCHWIAEALNATGEGCHWVHGVAQDKPGLAVLDCAARALRP
jgi:hypothetical protein